MSKKLTPRQQRFVDEYLIDLNATQAAIRAGYKEKTAYSMGQRLLKHVEVQTAIQKAQAEQRERLHITADKVLVDLEEARKTALENNQIAAAVKCSELHGKYIGIWKDKQEHTGLNGGPIALVDLSKALSDE